MRKRWLTVCLCILLSISGAAQASKWGMSGEMHEFLKKSGEYNNYTQIDSGYDRHAPCFPFIAGNGENSQLVVVRRSDSGQLEQVGRYPMAVLQPSAGRAAECWLGDKGNGIHLTPMWGKTGDYVHIGWDEDDTVRAEETLLLRAAEIGDLTFILQEDKQGYLVSCGEEHAVWETGVIPASEFCWAMMPETLEDVKAWNRVYAMIGESGVFDGRTTADLRRNKNLAVYGAPSRSAYRGARGKAAVSMAEPFHVLGEENGWWLVEYEISPAQRRVGYVQPPDNTGLEIAALQLGGRRMTLDCDTFLTDDPHGAAQEAAVLEQGESVWCFGRANAFWVFAEADNDGRTVRGFIPVSAVAADHLVIE